MWDPKVCVPKMARSDFPVANFLFSHDGNFGLEGAVQGEGGRGGSFFRCLMVAWWEEEEEGDSETAQCCSLSQGRLSQPILCVPPCTY